MKRLYLFLYLFIFLILSACSFPKASQPTITVTTGPSPTSTLIPSPTATIPTSPTPTPLPSVRINQGDKTLFNGDYPKAKLDYQNALATSADEKVKALAFWGLGKTDYLSGNYPSALDSLRLVVDKYPESDEAVNSWFLLGEIYFSLDRYQESVEAYEKYLGYRPNILESYIQGKLGNAYTALGDFNKALIAYQTVDKALGDASPTGIRIRIADTYAKLGQSDTALTLYDDIYSATTNDYIKAQIDLMAGRIYMLQGKTEEGYNRWRHAVENFPLAFDSYSALIGLVEANQPVDEFNRGMVDYYARKYDVALAAFQRFVSENPNHDGTVLYYMAFTLREMGDYQPAVDLWSVLIEKYPGNRYWASAWDERAFTLWAYLDNFESAAQGLETYSNGNNASPFASTYLFEAARIYERSGNLEKAATLWESLPGRFDADPSMANAWFQAGIARYRLGDYLHASADFQNSLLHSKELSDRAKSLFWIGKTYSIQGESANARSTLEQAQLADPNGYYSLRARDLLENREPFATPPTMNLVVDLPKERDEAASWVRIKFNLPADTDLSSLNNLKTDVRFLRGEEFWRLGLFDEARAEYDALREEVKISPENTFRLGNYLLDIGLYRSGIYSLRDLLTLAGLDDHSASLTAPVYFKHIRYGLYYSDLIWPAAAENAIDPLFVTSVVRQESLFEGFVRSSAGARGLMQIMPSTGVNIASQMTWPENFTENDLYSPYINIRMGTYYLNSNRRYLNKDLYATLAGYNSGPGNASIWQNLANGDTDLELEIIRYSETRNYIRNIYEIFDVYRGLYSPMQ